MGRFASPALASASYPFVNLADGITLCYELSPSDKFSKIRLYFFNGIAYNRASNKSKFIVLVSEI